VDQLKEQMNTAGVNEYLMVNMFHVDFKFHLKAIEALGDVNERITCCHEVDSNCFTSTQDLNVSLESQKANLDLVNKGLIVIIFRAYFKFHLQEEYLRTYNCYFHFNHLLIH